MGMSKQTSVRLGIQVLEKTVLFMKPAVEAA
jgi:hypothetical protein